MPKTHGMSGTPEYIAWKAMRQRVYYPKHDRHENYGGRGISIDSRWESFEAFYADMGPRPSDEHSLDREDVNGPYSKSNCRWATPEMQARNKQNTMLATYRGVTKSVRDWADELGVPFDRLRARLNAGQSPEEAFRAGVDKNRTIEFRGESLTVRQWAQRTGLSYKTILNRVGAFGWSVEKTLTTPVGRGRPPGVREVTAGRR